MPQLMHIEMIWKKAKHKLLLYFVAIFILPTLVRKLRDETTLPRSGIKWKWRARVGFGSLALAFPSQQENCQPQCGAVL